MKKLFIAVIAACVALTFVAPASAHHIKPGTQQRAEQPDAGYLHIATAGHQAIKRWEIPMAERLNSQVKLGRCTRIHRRGVNCDLIARGGKCTATVKVRLYLVNWKGHRDRHIHTGDKLIYRCAR